jgi:hypothetical protein
MFVQSGLRIPVLTVIGQDYVGYSQMRLYFETTINGTLFNVALYWLATSNLAIAWLHSSSRPQRVASVMLFLIVGAFDLARSPLGLALLMLLTYRLLWRPISLRPLVQSMGVTAALFVAVHYVAGAPGGYSGMGEYLGVRVFYGQWASLPYYFSLFEHDQLPFSSLLGPGIEGPARVVMQRMSPDGIDAGTAGVASSFFIGEAYAVAGVAGVILAPALVMVQVLAIVLCFRRLEKTTFNMFLYSWFLYKAFMGIVSGFSQFIFSFLQVMLLVLVYWVMVSGLLQRASAAVRAARSGVFSTRRMRP